MIDEILVSDKSYEWPIRCCARTARDLTLYKKPERAHVWNDALSKTERKAICESLKHPEGMKGAYEETLQQAGWNAAFPPAMKGDILILPFNDPASWGLNYYSKTKKSKQAVMLFKTDEAWAVWTKTGLQIYDRPILMHYMVWRIE